MFKDLDPQLARELQNVIEPIMERYLKEISSTKFYDAADAADSFYNYDLGKKFRDAGDARREEERIAEYDEVLQILTEFEAGDKKFYVAYYVPAQMKVLIYINDIKKCSIARIKDTQLLNIPNPEIITDIAMLFNKRKPVTGNAVNSIAKVLGHNRPAAQKYIQIINNAAGSHLTYRYLFADKDKRNVNLQDGLFKFLSGRPIGDYKVGIVKYMPSDAENNEDAEREDYSIYYAMVGHPDESFMIRLKTVEKTVVVEGPSHVSAPFRVMKKNGVIDGCAAPTSKTSDISKIYKFFKDHNFPEPGYDRPLSGLIISFFNTQLKYGFLTMDNIRRGFEAVYGQDDIDSKAVRQQQDVEAEDVTGGMLDL